MTHFETYHWEDHVPRAGSWKFNLAVGALAFGLIAAAMPEMSGEGTRNTAASANPAAKVTVSTLETQRRAEPAAFKGSSSELAQCPTTYADS